MEKSNSQTVSFAIIFVTVNGHKTFKNIFSDVQTEGKGGDKFCLT